MYDGISSQRRDHNKHPKGCSIDVYFDQYNVEKSSDRDFYVGAHKESSNGKYIVGTVFAGLPAFCFWSLTVALVWNIVRRTKHNKINLV